MRSTLLGLFAAVTLFGGAVRGADPAPVAQERANIYQREFRAALTQHGWSIKQEKAGQLTAERRWIPHNATGFVAADQGNSAYARLQVDFQAASKNRTATNARASLCIYALNAPEATYLVYPPLALRDPKLTQEYLDISAEAEAHLAASHRAFAAVEQNGPKVAVK